MGEITTVDARGLSCPEPLMLTRQAIQAGRFPIQVLVDSGTSRDNVLRMARGAGCEAEVEDKGDGFVLMLTKK